MKTNIVVIMLIFGSSLNAIAQNYSQATVISHKGDSLKGEIEVPKGSFWSGTKDMEINFVNLQKGTVLIDSLGVKHRIKPDKFKLVEIEYGNERITMVSMKRNSKMGSFFKKILIPDTFIKQELSGILGLYTYYSVQNNSHYNAVTGGMSYGGPKVVVSQFIKKDGRLHYLRNIGFMKKMTEVLCGCTQVLEKLDNGTYNKKDIYNIIEEYNTSCGNMNPLDATNCTYVSENKIRVSFRPVYGTYSMNSMKNLQNELLDDAASATNVPFSITDNFPGYFGYEISLGMNVKSFEFGLQFASRSTGGRFSYSDYSGRFLIDNYLISKEITVHVGRKISKSDKIELFFGAIGGLAFTDHTLSSTFQLEGEDEFKERYQFSSSNIIVGPNISFRFFPIKYVFIDVNARYDLHLAGKLEYNQSEGNYLKNNDNKEVKAEWNGIRGGLGIGFKF